ncbi:hypothetical protein WJX73_003529 [Symbiochloris irregularis]|uniref:Uncharacterized protein n=1 Tax=Symbiochloris irregularis TaxID=706552 RepID=A0AAW1PFL1_9CHLO
MHAILTIYKIAQQERRIAAPLIQGSAARTAQLVTMSPFIMQSLDSAAGSSVHDTFEPKPYPGWGQQPGMHLGIGPGRKVLYMPVPASPKQYTVLSSTGTVADVDLSHCATAYNRPVPIYAGEFIKIFELGSMSCVASYKLRHDGLDFKLHWGPEGTEGMVAVWPRSLGEKPVLFFGDLVDVPEASQGYPWDHMRPLDLPDSINSFDTKRFDPSPDGSKMTLDSDQQFLRGCEALQWHPASNTIFFCVWESRNRQTDYPSTPHKLCAVTIGQDPSNTWSVLPALGYQEDLSRVSSSVECLQGSSWVAVISRDIKGSGSSHVQAIILHWPSGCVHQELNDLLFVQDQFLWWDATGGHFAYLSNDDSSGPHRRRLSIMKLESQSSGDDASCFVRSADQVDHLGVLMGDWTPSGLHKWGSLVTMAWSASGKYLALAARHNSPFGDQKHPPSGQEPAVIVVDTSVSDLPIVAGLHVKYVKPEEAFEVMDLEWASDSATICALCQCYERMSPDAPASPAGDQDHSEQPTYRVRGRCAILFRFDG